MAASAGGGLAGAASGAAAGSVAGPWGTAIGGIAGGLLGAFGGGEGGGGVLGGGGAGKPAISSAHATFGDVIVAGPGASAGAAADDGGAMWLTLATLGVAGIAMILSLRR